MGMFDNVTVLCRLNGKFFEGMDWQTKSFDRLMSTYTVAPNGRLWVCKYDWRVTESDNNLLPICLEGDNGRNEFLPLTGTMEIHGIAEDGKWLEFDLTFHKGYLDDVVRIRERRAPRPVVMQ